METLDDVDESDLQQLLDVLTDAKTILCNTMETCRENGFGCHPPRVPGHVLKDNSDLPLVQPQGRFRKQAQYKHKCRMAPIEVEANTRVRLTFNWKVRTHER